MAEKEILLKRTGTAQTVELREKNGVPFMVFPALEATGVVVHGCSTRLGGVSQGDCATMNFAHGRGDDPANIRENFIRMTAALGVAPEQLVLSHQTHTTNIRQVTAEDLGKGYDKERDYQDIDGLMTDVPGAVLVTSYADCVPLLFVDPVRRAIASSHAGWRGTVSGMGRRTVEAMKEAYGCDPKDLIVAIGPSICQDCYEVSEDVAEEFARELGLTLPVEESGARETAQTGKEDIPDTYGETSTILKKTPGKEGKYQLDLWQANRKILVEAGVLPEHITITDVCTCCNKEVIFSHRGSQGRRGNMGVFLSLKEDGCNENEGAFIR